MKGLFTFLLMLCPLYAQNAGPKITEWLDEHGDVYDSKNYGVTETYKFIYQLSRDANGVKVFTFSVYDCEPPHMFFLIATNVLDKEGCLLLGKAAAEKFSPVTQQIGAFVDDAIAADAPFRIKYGALSFDDVRPFSTLAQRAASAASSDPYMVILDGLGGILMNFDLKTAAVTAQVPLPLSALGPLAIRPSATPPSQEVWVANGGLQISIVDLAAQKLLDNISTPAIPISAISAGIVFSNSGATAFEAVQYREADSFGNQGALLVFDAARRTLISMLPLQYSPLALVIAPDSLTAYVLSAGGEITYYDVLSGTADLSVSTHAPGMNSGYNSSNVFIHPDGTRLFWNSGPLLEVFDLTTHKVTAQFSSGLPTTSGVSFQMSQDGSVVTMSNGDGAVVLLDTRYGNTLGTIQNAGATEAFPGP